MRARMLEHRSIKTCIVDAIIIINENTLSSHVFFASTFQNHTLGRAMSQITLANEAMYGNREKWMSVFLDLIHCFTYLNLDSYAVLPRFTFNAVDVQIYREHMINFENSAFLSSLQRLGILWHLF